MISQEQNLIKKVKKNEEISNADAGIASIAILT